MFSFNEEEIIFSNNFNEPFTREIIRLLKTVKKITFGLNFNTPLMDIPDNITHISFIGNSFISKSMFNHPIDKNCLPKSLTHLTLGFSFNQPVDDLPFGITDLSFGNSFNQPVDNLPNSVINLKFGWQFNQPTNFLPSSLKELYYYRSFNQPVDNLPNSITHLKFGLLFNHPINNLPLNLTHLTLGEHYTDNRIVSLFNQPIEGLSRLINLKYLKLGHCFTQNICSPVDEHCYLPDSIEDLYVENGVDMNIINFPASMRRFYVNNRLRSMRNVIGNKRKRDLSVIVYKTYSESESSICSSTIVKT